MTGDPVQFSCQQNFTIMTTDGYWNSQTETPGGGPVEIDGVTPVAVAGGRNPDGTLTPPSGLSPRPIWEGFATDTSRDDRQPQCLRLRALRNLHPAKHQPDQHHDDAADVRHLAARDAQRADDREHARRPAKAPPASSRARCSDRIATAQTFQTDTQVRQTTAQITQSTSVMQQIITQLQQRQERVDQSTAQIQQQTLQTTQSTSRTDQNTLQTRIATSRTDRSTSQITRTTAQVTQSTSQINTSTSQTTRSTSQTVGGARFNGPSARRRTGPAMRGPKTARRSPPAAAPRPASSIARP